MRCKDAVYNCVTISHNCEKIPFMEVTIAILKSHLWDRKTQFYFFKSQLIDMKLHLCNFEK